MAYENLHCEGIPYRLSGWQDPRYVQEKIILEIVSYYITVYFSVYITLLLVRLWYPPPKYGIIYYGKEKHIGSVVSEIIWYTQKDRQTLTNTGPVTFQNRLNIRTILKFGTG